MKTLIYIPLFISSFFTLKGGEAEKNIKSKPEKVVVYNSGAQIFRTVPVALVAGENRIVFESLEDGISPSSIQAGGNGNFIITETEYGDKMPELEKFKNPTDLKYARLIKQINDSIGLIDYKLEDITYKNEVLSTEKSVLLNYRLFKGDSRKDSLAFLKEGLTYLKEKLTLIYTELHALKKETAKLQEAKQGLHNRLNGIQADLGDANYNANYKANHRVVVSLICETPALVSLTINYFVTTAGWEPMYDLRTEGVESSVKLTYKGMVHQHTGIDWSNVKLVLSTGSPQANLQAPQLNTWYIDEIKITHHDRYNQKNLNEGQKQYTTATGNTAMEMPLSEDREAQQAFEFVTMDDQQVQATFEIKLPYSIASDNKKHTVAVLQKDLNTKYMYKVVPKADVNAYLLARVTGWEDLNLLAGKASIFYNGTYIGQSYINPAVANDTLDLTLGKDDNVVVKRYKQKDKIKEKIMNDDKIYSFAYEIVVKNGNTKSIDVQVVDQLPLNHSKQVTITKDELSGAGYNESTGVLTWRLTIKSKDTRHINFSYSVKAPKDLPVAVR